MELFKKKITTGVGQRPKLEQLRPNKSGELEIMQKTCTIGMDLGQILTDFQNERQRCKSLGGSGGMLPMGIFLFQLPKVPFPGFLSISDRILASSFSWDEALQLGKFFSFIYLL